MILLIFIIPGLIMTLNMAFLLPILVDYIPMFWAVVICLWLPLVLTSIFVLIRWSKSKTQFTSYFRIGKINKKHFFIILVIFIIVQALELLLSLTRGPLSELAFFKPPHIMPEVFLPSFEPSIPLASFMGISLAGYWPIILMWSLWLLLNIGCEEFLWRGYALPRMEKVFGKYAWLINGLCWNFIIHFFMRWSWISLMPISLILPYVAYKTKSIWPGVIIHGLGNVLLFIILIPSI